MLRPGWLGPYLIIAVGLEVVRIIQDRNENTVSMNRVALTTHLAQEIKENEKHNSNKNDDWQRPKNLDLQTNRQYLVDHIA